MKLLIVGGYGTFGGRIIQLLESEPRFAAAPPWHDEGGKACVVPDQGRKFFLRPVEIDRRRATYVWPRKDAAFETREKNPCDT
ncbi:hypothetical protein [Mesorhizobium sp. NZP2298]|uniref:hypothetical protein n=1 Tax=Mesorhizobium sp. NZP2298 TaxID=2483403 RepID=UPI001557B1A0|nr:hypothetical protein [Mesorhizobium sp. NZP2298]QKC94001.1 hypothetical protein EB231_04175 [Mesorhizobium sp. NZP2298]